MNTISKKKIVYNFILIISLLLIFFVAYSFKTTENQTTWNGYKILAVPLELEELFVVDQLVSAGITQFSSECNAKFNGKEYKIPANLYIQELNQKITQWFVNKEEAVRFIYIEDSPHIEKKIHSLATNSLDILFFEVSDHINFIYSLLLFVLYFFILLRFRTRIDIKLSFFPIICMPLFFNTFLGFLLSFIVLCSFFLFDYFFWFNTPKIWKEQMRLPNKIIVFVTFFLLLLVLMISKLIGFVFLILTTISCFIVYRFIVQVTQFYLNYKNKKRIHRVFVPVSFTLRPRPLKYSIKIVYSAIFFVLFIGMGFLSSFLGKNQRSIQSEQLSFPSPSGYTEKGISCESFTAFVSNKKTTTLLPDLSDFIMAHWLSDSAFYTKIQKDTPYPQENDTINWVTYTIDDQGFIKSEIQTMHIFNESYLANIFSKELSTLEKMLVLQNNFISVEYKRSAP